MKVKDYVKIGALAAYLTFALLYAQNTQPLEQRIKEKQEQYDSNLKTIAETEQSKLYTQLAKADSLLVSSLKDKYFDREEQSKVLDLLEEAEDLEEKINDKYSKDIVSINKEHKDLIDNIKEYNKSYFKEKYGSEFECHEQYYAFRTFAAMVGSLFLLKTIMQWKD